MYSDFLYFDIETTTKYATLDLLKLNDPRGYDLFLRKCQVMSDFNEIWRGGNPEDLYIDKGPLLAEHGKIICLSFGIYKDGAQYIRTFIKDNEEELMTDIKQFFDKMGGKRRLCGYNIKNFDIPWIIRKLFKYNLGIPMNLNIIDKKPWETGVVDISDIWKLNGKYNVPMDEVAYELGVESSKGSVGGDKVHHYYYDLNDTKSIMNYCEADVRVIMEIAKRLSL
jgi:3'-5' exonuclease